MKQHIRQHVKRNLFLLTLMLLMLSMALPASAAAKIRISKKKATLYVGETLQLKVKGAKKVTWSSSAKKVAKVSKKGKVTALKKGSAKITAKVNGKKYVCRITVKEKPAPATQPSQPSPASITPSTPSNPVDPSKPQETEKPQSQTEPATEPQTDPVDPTPTQRTVSSQADLNEALLDEKLETITLASGNPDQISVPEGDYSGVELIVNMPQGDVTNHGQFRLIRIRAIARDTFVEQATGNTIIYEAGGSGRIVVEEGASAQITVPAAETAGSIPSLTVENRSTQSGSCTLTLEGKANVVLTGSGSEVEINAKEAAEGSIITTSVPIRLTAGSHVSLVLQEGSDGSSVKVNDKANVPDVYGVGSVSVTDTGTGRITSYTAKSLLSIIDVTGDGVTGYATDTDRLIVYTDWIDQLPAPELIVPTGVNVRWEAVEEDGEFYSEGICVARAVISVGEPGTEDYEEEVWYVCFEYRTAQGKGTKSFLADVETIASDDIDDWEVRKNAYGRKSLALYYDRYSCAEEPKYSQITFADGTQGELVYDPSTETEMIRKGIWTSPIEVAWFDSFELRELKVDGKAAQYGSARNEDQGIAYVDIHTTAWEYPVITIDVPQRITYEVQWDANPDSQVKCTGSLTLNNGKRELVYDLRLYYSGNLNSRIQIQEASGSQVDGYKVSLYNLILYCDVKAGEHPETFTVKLQDGSTETVTAECGEYDNWSFIVHSGIWSKKYSLSWGDSFVIDSLAWEESYGDPLNEIDGYTLRTSVWDHYPSVTVTPKYSGIQAEVTWFGENSSDMGVDDDPETDEGEIRLTNGRGGVRKFGLDLRYETEEGGLETVEITDISGENLAGWEKKESVGIGLYYEKDYCQKPLDLTVQLEKGESRQTSVKLLDPEYGDYEYAQLAVRSGIWTLYYNAFYADCYALSTDDISVEGAVYYPYYDETNKTFSVGTTLWDTYPKVEVHVHGVVPTVEWFGEESGEQITSGALAGKLTLSRGEHKAEYGLRLGYSGQGDNALDKLIQVQSVSAGGISLKMEWTGYEQKTLTLYLQNETRPQELTVTKTDGDTCVVDVLYEETSGYYIEVPGGIWKRKINVEFRAAGDESASEGSNLNGSVELDEDITDLLLTEDEPEQVQEETPDLYAEAAPEYDIEAPVPVDENVLVFTDETADDEIIAEESAFMWDGQEEGSW